MSFLFTDPNALTSASGSISSIGADLTSSNAAAAGPTTGVVPPASDPVSALTAAHFASHAALYQAISAQAALVHQQVVSTLGTNAGSYTTAEAANAAANVLGAS
jgi:hypothetical protein